MKKRILSILLTLCMVLMLCPVTALAEEGKTVSFTVTADKTEAQSGETINFTVTMGAVDRLGYLMLGLSIPEGMTYVAHSGTVPEGLKEKMSAEDVEVFELPYLYVLSSDYTSTADTVLMTFQCTVNDDATPGDKAVGVCLVYDDEGGCLDVDSKVIAATFTPATVTVPEPVYNLEITVDGFEVGKTPADCTFSFESTIPGVTFDEEDIKAVVWERFIFVGASYDWRSFPTTTAFQADTAYRFMLSLDNNGLDKLPAITLNGNPVEDCNLAISEGVPAGIEMIYELGTPPEPPQYTITYEGGEGVEGSIPAGVKARGEAFTLSSDTFTREGFVQTGWVDESGAIYDLGGDYMLDEDMTFYPYWEKRITLTVPYTTTVALGDAGEPGETAFDLALVGSGAGEYDAADVTVSGTVTTDGAGDYNGTLAITGPEWTLWHLLSEGAFVQQVDAGEAGWTVDDTVWGLLMEEIPVAYAMSDDAVASEYTVLILPASCKGTGEDVYYDLDWNATPLERMSFTNTYTKSATEPTNPVNPTDPSNPTNPSNPTGSNPNTGALDKVPQTGDNSNMILWIVLLLASGLGVTGTVVYSKRKI